RTLPPSCPLFGRGSSGVMSVSTGGGIMADENETRATPPVSPASKSSGDAWIGGAVWIVGIAVGAFVWLFPGGADVLLNVAGTDPVVATGTVTNDGAPVGGGTIQVLTEDPRSRRLLGSAVTSVTDKGT